MNFHPSKGIRRVCWLSLMAVSVAAVTAASAQETPLYFEDFVGMDDGTLITTGNTSLTVAKSLSGLQGNVYVVADPSPLDSGPAARILTSSTNTSGGSQNVQTAGFTGTTALNVGTFSFSVYTPAEFVALNNLTITSGTGNQWTPSNQGIYSAAMAAQAAYALRISDTGALQINMSGSSNAFTDLGGFTFSASTAYEIYVNFNTSGSSVSYAGGEMASNTGDLRINGVLVADDFAMRNAGRPSSMFTLRIGGGLDNTQSYYFDNLAVYDSAVVPEPTTVALAALSLMAAAYAVRRRNSGRNPRDATSGS